MSQSDDVKFSTVAFILGVVLASVFGFALAASNSGFQAGDNTTFGTNTGLDVQIGQDLNVSSVPFKNDSTVQLPSGIVHADGPGHIFVPDADLNGTPQTFSEINATQTTIWIVSKDHTKRVIGVSGDLDNITRYEMAVGDDQVDFEYAGTGTSASVYIKGLPSDTGFAARNATSGEWLDANVSSANGTLALTDLPLSSHDAELIEADNAPSFSNATPTDVISDTPFKVGANISDDDFANGDTVDYTIRVNGTVVDTGTISDEQWVNHTVSSIDIGDHTWSIAATDDTGQTTTANYTFSTPKELVFKNRTSPRTNVTGTTLTVTLYELDGEEIFSRTTSDGNISMRGLPVSGPYEIVVEGSGFYDRRTYIESITEQNKVYLLSTKFTSVDIDFTLNDKSGDYPKDSTRLAVQAALNTSDTANGAKEWQTISGDVFGGVNVVPTTIQKNEEYRLVVRNRDGDRRIIGRYLADASTTQAIEINEFSIDADDQKEGYAADITTFEQDADLDGTKEQWVRVKFKGNISSVDYNVTRRSDGTELANASMTQVGDEVVATYKVNESVDENTYVLNYEVDADTGSGSGQKYAGDVPDVTSTWPIDDKWLEMLGYMGVVAVTGLVVIVDAALATVAAVAVAGLLTIIGVLAIPMELIMMAAAVAILSLFGRDRGV